MNTFPSTSQQPIVAPKKKRGCFFYGCLTVIILSVLAVVGIYFGVRYFISNVVENYTSTTQMALPPAPTGLDYKTLADRVETFVQAVKTGNGPKELVLTSDEINTLITQHPEFAPFKDALRVSIKDNAVFGQVSYPLDAFGYPGHYFNGQGEFGIVMQNGVLEVSVKSLEVKGQPVPEQILQELNKKNPAAKAYENPESREVLKKIEQIKLGDGKVVILRR